jgi:phosphopantothenoylcysteine decarboxylase
VVLAPAMNTLMWEHPATSRHLAQLLEDFGGPRPLPHLGPEVMCDTINNTCDRLHVVKPVSKRLACGDAGVGGLASVEEIAAAVSELIGG